MIIGPDFNYKNDKFRKRKQKLFDELKKSDLELIKIFEDWKIWRTKTTKAKTEIKVICKNLDKDSRKLNKRYAKRLRELRFKIDHVFDSGHNVEFKGW